jgi:SAM-dependent methyltransferase
MPSAKSSAKQRAKAKLVSIHASKPAVPKPAPIHPFDARFGTDTGGLIPGSALASGHSSDPHITAYYAIAPSILDALIDLWLQTPPPLGIDRYTLLDVGAGKGRAILNAAQHPFHRVIGIELNPQLAAIARANIARFIDSPAASPLAPVQLLEGDALQVLLPETPTLITLFHPFEAPILRRFIARLEQHSAQRPGRVDILYINAEHASVLDRNPAFTRLFNGMVPMSREDYLADMAEIAEQKEYGSTGDEFCTIHRFTGRTAGQV